MQTALLVLALVVKGTVVNQGGPLPGTTVTLTSPAVTRTTVSDAEGHYELKGVDAGRYTIKYELPGLETVERPVDVGESTTIPPQELSVGTGETITLGCHMTCDDALPETPFDLPFCGDETLHDVLIDAVKTGDHSALALLQKRYEAEVSAREKHRLAGVLLEQLENDGAIWNELAADAAIAIRFPEKDDFAPEFTAYCDQRHADPYDVWEMSYDALLVAGSDPRSRALLRDALKTGNRDLIGLAIIGFAEQHDASALPLIAAALEGLREDARDAALYLSLYRTADADALAFKYIVDESTREAYRSFQEPQEEVSARH